MRIIVGCGLLWLAFDGLAAEPASRGEAEARAVRAESLRGVRATYCRAPRMENGRANVPLLVQQLVEIHANTYSFCIHSGPNDWEDLQLFLPEARKHGIRVWGSVVPPSESPPRSKKYAEPFRLDYERWAVEFAKLSLRETNLVAWSIDDFSHNLKTAYTPNELQTNADGGAGDQSAAGVRAVLLLQGDHAGVRERLRAVAGRDFISVPA